jgi:hypothetical protein
MAFTISDFAIVSATLIGPILAVQVQKFIERAQAGDRKREGIFRTLMAMRAQTLAPQHIEALNLIDIEFEKKERFKPVRAAWKAYLSHLGETPPTDPQEKAVYFGKRPDLLTELLYEMGTALGHEVDRTQIKREAYVTVHHAMAESQLDTIRAGLAAVFSGRSAMPMAVVSFPADAEAAKAQADYLTLIAELIRERKPFPVEIVEGDQSQKG